MKTKPNNNTMNQRILVDKQDRSKLAEGRTQGLGYGFCKKDGDTYTTVQAPTACKDFLSDVVYSEQTGKDYRIYGLSTRKTGLFDCGRGYMAMAILPPNRGSSYDEMSEDNVLLAKNYKVMEAAMRWVEQGNGVKEADMTVIEPTTTDGWFIVEVPPFWLQSAPYISCATWLLRIAMYGFDDKDPIAAFKKQITTIPDEMYNWKLCDKLAEVANGKKLVSSAPDDPHGYGFCHAKTA